MKQNFFQTPIKVWYKVLPGRGKSKWPIIDIKLSYKKFSLPQPILALVDSGASHSILHPFVAEILGFNLEGLGFSQKGLSASGDYRYLELPSMNMDINGYKFNQSFTVIDNKDLIWPCILGEDSIFHSSRLDFYKFKGYFEVRFRTDIN